MTDWVEALNPEERSSWDDFVDAFRKDALEKIVDSGAFLSLVPTAEHFDAKFAIELGTAIMLDKPLIVVAMPGAEIPTRLRAIADYVIEEDVDTEEGRQAIADALKSIQEGL